MKNAAIILVASVAAVSAQLTLENNTYTCGKPNVAYCAGDSMKTDIIVRCDSQGKGTPGRCGNNLAGQPPLGNTPAFCVQSDNTVGDAACEKNCIVYGGSGGAANTLGTFTLPIESCTPTFTQTGIATSLPGTGTITGTTTSLPGTLTSTPTMSDTFITPTTRGSFTSVRPGTSSYPNGTVITITSTSFVSGSNTPTGPSTTVSTAGAVAHQVGAGIAALGVVAAYLI